jgi:pantoate--beta-alanine ligase
MRARRPGHFRGVATVVLKLFNAVEPSRAYFGRKDAQQLRVLQRMATDLDLPVAIVPCDIVREPDGLAMSSRNVYLTRAQREAAPIIYRSLCAARAAFERGERRTDALRNAVHALIAAEPLAGIDYISLADDATLEELSGEVERPALLSLVVRFGPTRLLDNVELG